MSAVRVVSSIRHTLSEDDTIRPILLAPFGQEFMTEFVNFTEYFQINWNHRRSHDRNVVRLTCVNSAYQH